MARASLEELKLDYEDFLRQRKLPPWEPGHPALARFRARKCATLGQVREWISSERAHGQLGAHGQTRTITDKHGQPGEHQVGDPAGSPSVSVRVRPCPSVPRTIPSAVLAANAALSLLNLCCHLLDRQLAAQAAAFEREGGFTERLYRLRRNSRGSW